MLYFKNIMISRKFFSFLSTFVLLMLVAVPTAMGFVVEQANSRLQDGTFIVNAIVKYEFSEVVLEALDNGVPITVDMHFQVRRKGAWIWEKDIVDEHRRRQLRYLPLSDSYEVTDIDGKVIKLYFSRTAAITALGEVVDYAMVREDQLEAGESYLMEVRSQLDIEWLPVPLRPKAYMSSDWKLSSEWSQWLIKP